MFYHGCCCGGLLGGLWHFDCVYELFVDILRICGVVAFEFFSRCVVFVSYIDISCVVSVAENLSVFDRGGSVCLDEGGGGYGGIGIS